ncbi:helix-turn-helix domain-containing protein [Enterococcus rivorum]|uniref:Mga helix-turn-helix domain-containing protein n=1 Tax=Enterococcus rivorum TaxID=762845 RepID=A0A1E5KU99_9ENTE|nr:helix-turn-helix domain-containing protein [Enterococcus rivorum]MBP2098965.1 hypothetical protein [Enterococcus rivorum]OEH81441.1 hypothetical protein BCR26_04120 [Enterococcus rivorum]
MKQILSSKNRRQLEFIELLFENDWITLTKASELLGVPTKTLKVDIHDLETLFDQVTIETSKKHGVSLMIEPSFCKASIYQSFLKNSLEFQLIENIFVQNTLSINELADDLYISVSTTKRMISRINKVLQLEGFSIHPKEMKLMGDPLSICNFMKRYYTEKYATAETLMSANQIELLDTVLLSTLEEHFPNAIAYQNYSFLNRLRISAYTIIQFLKTDAGDLLNVAPPEKEFSIVTNKQVTSEFYRQFLLQLTPFTLSNILYSFFNSNYVYSIEELLTKVKTDSPTQRKYNKITSLIQDLEKKIDCPCTNFDDLLLQLYNLDNQLCGRTFILYNTNKEFYISLLNVYGSFVSDMIHSLQGIFYQTPHKEYIVYEAFFVLFTKWENFLESLECSVPSIKAGLLLDTGKEFTEILAKKMEYYFNNRFVCTPINLSCLDELEKIASSFDCIITNIPTISLTNVPVIVTPVVFNTKNFDKLMVFYENYFKGK